MTPKQRPAHEPLPSPLDWRVSRRQFATTLGRRQRQQGGTPCLSKCLRHPMLCWRRRHRGIRGFPERLRSQAPEGHLRASVAAERRSLSTRRPHCGRNPHADRLYLYGRHRYSSGGPRRREKRVKRGTTARKGIQAADDRGSMPAVIQMASSGEPGGAGVGNGRLGWSTKIYGTAERNERAQIRCQRAL